MSGPGIATNVFYLGLGPTMVVAILLSSALVRMFGPAQLRIAFLVSAMATFAYTIVELGGGPLVVVVRASGTTSKVPASHSELLVDMARRRSGRGALPID